MNSTRKKICCLVASLVASVSLHVLILSCLSCLGPHNFTKPVMMEALVDIDLKSSILPQTKTQPEVRKVSGGSEHLEEIVKPREKGAVQAISTDDETVKRAKKESVSKSPDAKPPEEKGQRDSMADPVPAGGELTEAVQHQKPRKISEIVITPPLRAASEFMTSEREKLTYRISLLGMPAGNAELEAKRENGEVRISLRVTSNPFVSSFYPVNDFIETRHIGGNFILTKISQQEGTIRSDRGFTIFLREKSVFWIDRLTNRSTREAIPNSEVVDILSGFYYLRNRTLQVGTQEQLHIYDSDSYASVPVEVLRRETVTLPGFRKTETLVVRPLLRTEGIFKWAGDVHIWLTDDNNKVPVRIETSIPLGRVVAELIAAETEQIDTNLKH